MDENLPTSKGIQMIAVYVAMGVTTTIVFALRMYVRLKLVKWSWEDWAALVGWFIYMIFCGSATVGPFFGTGQHMHLLSPENMSIALRQWYIAELTYVAANLAVKLSIALMLLRFAVEEYQKMSIYIVTATTQVYSVIFLFIFAFQCVPSSLFWMSVQGATDGHCLDPKIIVITGYTYLAVTIVYDWTMAILPWFIVRKMHLDLRTKRMIAIVLALGSIASITTLIRIPYVADLASTKDFLYDNVNLAIWACIETGLSIIASSATTLKPLFRRGSLNENRGVPGRLTPKLNSIAFTTESDDSEATAIESVGADSSTKKFGSEVSEMRHGSQV